ncbi:MAG: ABC transporter substrate-binding protein [Thermomicrobiales bacterium]|nr:ABC transporter substrate-binding protein [Thermomicrobiales bacterium]
MSALLALAVVPYLTLAQTPVATPSAFPRTVTHASGETTIPAPPERIVTTNENEPLDSLLSLGLEPVLFAFGGGYGDRGLAPWAVAAGADQLPSFTAVDLFLPDPERIAEASPDLILGTWLEPDSYEQLSGIAPTINLKYSEETTWDEVQRLVGEATGRDAEAEAVIADTLRVIDTACEDLQPLAGTRVAIAYAWSDSFLVNGENAALGRLLSRCGLEVVSPATEPPGGIATLSLEQMQQVTDADILLSLAFDPAAIAQQEASPLFRTLPAVKDGHYVVLSPEMAQAFYLESALSLQWAVPQLVDAVEQAAAGEGTRLD